MNGRQRKVDLNKLSKSEADQLGEQIGDKLRVLIDKSVEEANNFLKIYGIKAKMQVALEPIEEPKGE